MKANIIMRMIDILGNVIQQQFARMPVGQIKRLEEERIRRLEEAIKKLEPKIKKEEKIEKEEKGTACLPCARHHFSTVSAALNEAIRFARSEGIKHPEVVKRIGIATDELNIMERIDLSAENVAKLSEKEREIAEWALVKARELRHLIDAIRNYKDLEHVAAEASEIRTEFFKKLFDITVIDVDDLVRKTCARLEGEEKAKCEKAVREFVKNKDKFIKELEECPTCKKRMEELA